MEMEMQMEIMDEKIVIIIDENLLHSDIEEFADLKNQIAKCLYKINGIKQKDLTYLFRENNERK